MKKWQRNVIYRAVEAGGLDPRECTFDYGDTGARITHVPSASYLLLEGDITAYTAKAVVGDSEQWPFGLRTFWVEVEERVRGWAQQVKEHVDTPDLWAGLQREREILTGLAMRTSKTHRSLRTSRRRLRSISDRRRST